MERQVEDLDWRVVLLLDDAIGRVVDGVGHGDIGQHLPMLGYCKRQAARDLLAADIRRLVRIPVRPCLLTSEHGWRVAQAACNPAGPAPAIATSSYACDDAGRSNLSPPPRPRRPPTRGQP